MLKIRNNMLKPTILAIAMATVMAGAAISPALGLMADAFPDASETTIKLILTIPSLMIVPFSFLSSYLTKKIQKRTIILIGLIIYIIGGIGPQFVTTIEMIILLRLVLGIGVGLVMPMSTTLIHDHYTGKERTQMIGFQSAFNNLGGIVTMMVAGWLAAFGWRIPFNVYFLGLIIFILTFLFVPKNEIEKETTIKGKREKLPLKVYGYALAMGGVMLIYYTIATNIALFLQENDIGGAKLAGIVAACTTIGGMLTSFLLIHVESLFKQYIIPVLLLFMGMAFFTLYFTSSIPLIMMSVVVIGLGQGGLFPTIILRALDVAPKHLASRTIAWTSSFTFVGQFLSPITLDAISALVGQDTIRFQYGVLAISVTLFAFASTFYIRKKVKQ